MQKYIYAIILVILFTDLANSQCVGTPGQVSWHFWRELPFYDRAYLYNDDTYPAGPDGVRVLNSLAAPTNYDDHFGSVVKGFISSPSAAAATFNVTGDDGAYFLLSTNASKANLDTIAYFDEYTDQNEHTKFTTQTSAVINLAANQRYYFEVHSREGGGGDHASVFWQRPFVDHNSWQLIASPYLTDVCDPVCPPKGTACNDGNGATTDDMEDGSCNCIGKPAVGSLPVGERSKLDAYFYDNVAGGDLNTLLTDPDFPTMPDRLTMYNTGLSAQWEDNIDNYGTLVQAYITVPITGSYSFNVTGVADVRMYMSSDGTEANKMANMIETQWGTGPLDHDVPSWNGSQTMTVSLSANTYYYIEILQNVPSWGHRFDIYWKGPQYDDTSWHRIPELFLYDYTAELACLPIGAACDDGDPFTADDQIVSNCICQGTPCPSQIACDDPEALFIDYDYCTTTQALGTRPDDAWLSCTPQATNPYVPARNGMHWIHYDLGNEYKLHETNIWNYNVQGETDKGFEQVAVDYSIDGTNWFELGTFSWSQASGQSNYTGFMGPDFNGMPVRYVMFTSLDNPNTCRGISKSTFNIEYCATQGLACDDNNPITYNDHYDDKCACGGYTLAQLDCAVDTLFLNEQDLSSNAYHAMMALMSEGSVMNASDVHYRAGAQIVLDSGFEVEIGSSFEANIEDCPSSSFALVPTKKLSKKLEKKMHPEEALYVHSLAGMSQQTIRFFLPEPSNVKLEIMDQKGNLAHPLIEIEYENFGDHYKRLQTKKIKPGIYMVKMTTEKDTHLEKLVVLESGLTE